MLAYNIIVKDFELLLRYYVNFRGNIHRNCHMGWIVPQKLFYKDGFGIE